MFSFTLKNTMQSERQQSSSQECSLGLFERNISQGTQICENVGFSICCDCPHDTILQYAIALDAWLLDASNTLEEGCFLLHAIALESREELPHRRVTALEQCLNSVVPSFHAVCRSGYSISSSSLIC